jgi:DNA helicase-2/ATP-dependent DNA helicase PcrA
MIEWENFVKAVSERLNRDLNKDENQCELIRAPKNQSFFAVAGPGSGKTTVIVLRCLKLIFVDGVNPSKILVTTFTRKAAAELRSRLLGWGEKLIQALLPSDSERIYLNQIITGTLDSIIEETLAQYRPPGAGPPVVIEDFASKGLLWKIYWSKNYRNYREEFRKYAAEIKGTEYQVDVAQTLFDIKDRIFHDQVRVRNFSSPSPLSTAYRIISEYLRQLKNRGLYDFATLEQEFLERLQEKNTLEPFVENLDHIFVDEYQDTNRLQEKIYFELAKRITKKGGSITVVGDDDQSLYRFRGATVDLFCKFPERIKKEVGIDVQTVYLSQNYRSTKTIVEFCNKFIGLDQVYQSARVTNKPLLKPAGPLSQTEFPILGMFRGNEEELARDLAGFIRQLVDQQEYRIKDRLRGIEYVIKLPNKSPSNIAFLSHSPREFSGNEKRLPKLLRDYLEPDIKVFNPRGESLHLIPCVQQLCGLILQCIDPDQVIQSKITRNLQETFDSWRRTAAELWKQKPELEKYVDGEWQKAAEGNRVSVLGLIYNLVKWIPKMQCDVEGLVYLEAITRTVTQAALFGSYGGYIILRKEQELGTDDEWDSRQEVLTDILAPIASGVIDVTEELLETLPPDRLSIMSFHQAKGLEFPITIVDIGSHRLPKNLRFPDDPERLPADCRLEDELRQYSELGKPQRSAVDRAFDDLIRRYFVAYSRAQYVLMLVGLDSIANGKMEHVAAGWTRQGCRKDIFANMICL